MDPHLGCACAGVVRTTHIRAVVSACAVWVFRGSSRVRAWVLGRALLWRCVAGCARATRTVPIEPCSEPKGVRSGREGAHVGEPVRVHHWVPISVVVRPVQGAIAAAALPHIIQPNIRVAQGCQGHIGAREGRSHSIHGGQHDLLVNVPPVLIPVPPAPERRCIGSRQAVCGRNTGIGEM